MEKNTRLYYRIGIPQPFGNQHNAEYGKKYERLQDAIDEIKQGEYLMRHGHDGNVSFYRYSEIAGFVELS